MFKIFTNMTLSNTVNRKFEESYSVSDWEIETDTGWKDILEIHKTIPYKVWKVVTSKGFYLECADTHIVFDEHFNEIFVKDLIVGQTWIQINGGIDYVVELYEYDYSENMYDLTIDSEEHRFYTNGILSHNTTTSVGFILWATIFQEHYSIAITANKKSLAIEILGRYQLAYENLPMWLQQGVVEWNKGTIELENGSKVLAAATSASSIRGGSFNCVTGDTKITICDDFGRIFYIDIQRANSPEYKYYNKLNYLGDYMYYTVYKITNLKNNKEYIGYHHTNDLNDGYMGSGKLIKRAIEKYGIDNFKKEYIEIFDNREQAESLEALLVNEEYTLRDDTYNLAIGGNVRTLCGKNNGFFNKKHSEENIKLYKELFTGKNMTLYDDIIINGIRYNSFFHMKQELKLSNGELIKLMTEENNGYVDQERQNALIKKIDEQIERKKRNRIALTEIVKIKLKGKTVSEETKRKLKETIKKNGKTEKQKAAILKTNKNPEKIRKTAETHTGMKRSEQARKNISESRKGKPPGNKGKTYCFNPETFEKKLCFEHEIPEGWTRGVLSRVSKK